MSHPAVDPPASPPPRRLHWTGRRIWLLLILGSLATSVLAHQFLYSSVLVLGVSMEPTLHEGERRLVNRWRFKLNGVQRGDLLVFTETGTPYTVVKRVIALPGDSLQLRADGVYLNGALLPEPYVAPGGYTHSRKMGDQILHLGAGEYFVMGDNRLQSQDSRWYGPVHSAQVLGILDN